MDRNWMEKEWGKRGVGRERVCGVEGVKSVLLYIIALDGVRRGIHVNKRADDTVYKSSRWKPYGGHKEQNI